VRDGQPGEQTAPIVDQRHHPGQDLTALMILRCETASGSTRSMAARLTTLDVCFIADDTLKKLPTASPLAALRVLRHKVIPPWLGAHSPAQTRAEAKERQAPQPALRATAAGPVRRNGHGRMENIGHYFWISSR
jgi:hypothetical protein